MDILSFDPDHLARQEMLRHQMPFDSFANSLVQISSGFIISIMGALGGLAQQPIQSVQESDSFLKGVSKGIIGLVTKPVGAVAELVNQTGQGILRVTGVNRIPPSELRLQRRALNKEFSRFNISMVKCLRKLILTTSTHTINGMIEAVYSSSSTQCVQSEKQMTHQVKQYNTEYNMTGCYLVLGEHTLYIIDKREDSLLRAFHLSQIDISIKNETSLLVELNVADLGHSADESVNAATQESEYEKMYENTLDRLVDFVEQASAAVQLKTNSNEAPNYFLKSINSSIFMDYYRFERIDYASFLKQYNGLPCNCGFMLTSLANAVTLPPPSSSPSPAQLPASATPAAAVNKQTINRTASQDTASSSAELLLLPRVHRIKSSECFIPPAAGNPSSIEVAKRKQFVYYIDPRLADNFVSIFCSLKRKLLNKGFQF